MIVATLLIILLVLVAIGIIWVVVKNVLVEGSDQVGLGKFLVDLQMKRAYLNGDNVQVNVKRGIGEGELAGMTFVFSNGETSKIVSLQESLGELESGIYTFSSDTIGLPATTISSVSVAPIYISGSGSENTGEITGSADITEAPESFVPIGVCGDNIVDPGEICDGTALNGLSCSDFGQILGELACLQDCSAYDDSDCSGGQCVDESEPCPLQQGVCEGSQQTCVENAWPGCDYLAYNSSYDSFGETGDLCTDGFDNDCDGLTDNDEDTCEETWEGVVQEPWPGATKILFIVNATESDPTLMLLNHNIRYISFGNEGGGSETRCIQIVDYILPGQSELFDSTVISLDESVDGGLPINIVTGDHFTIYEKSECGVF